jgi:hypothetical protein
MQPAIPLSVAQPKQFVVQPEIPKLVVPGDAPVPPIIPKAGRTIGSLKICLLDSLDYQEKT